MRGGYLGWLMGGGVWAWGERTATRLLQRWASGRPTGEKISKTKCRVCVLPRPSLTRGEADGRRDDGTGRRRLLRTSAAVSRRRRRSAVSLCLLAGRCAAASFTQFDEEDQLNWHDSQAARVTKLKGTKRWKLSQSGRLGGGYLSKILKLSINRERRTSLIKIIHALLHGVGGRVRRS